MAQNVNPFSSMQNTPTKAAEEKQSLPKDNHAVSKRYAESGPLASIASLPSNRPFANRASLSFPATFPEIRNAIDIALFAAVHIT